MKKIYHLSNCNTCQRIISELGGLKDFEHINIKEKNISAKDLDAAAKALGGYEAVFSKRAMKYRSMGLNEMALTEKDYRAYILEEYTFLKRPVVFVGDMVFAGNSKKTVESIKAELNV